MKRPAVGAGMRFVRVLLGLLLVACRPEAPDTLIEVILDAEPALRSATARLRVRVGVASESDERTRDLGAGAAWPLRLPLRPEVEESRALVRVDAELLDHDGRVLAQAGDTARFDPGRRVTLHLRLQGGCSGDACEPDTPDASELDAEAGPEPATSGSAAPTGP